MTGNWWQAIVVLIISVRATTVMSLFPEACNCSIEVVDDGGNCEMVVDDTSPFFQDLYDVPCLVRLQSPVNHCMLDAAHKFFDTFVGQWQITRLCLNLLAFVAVSTLQFSAEMPEAEYGWGPKVAQFLFSIVQWAQITACMMSLVLVFMSYASAIAAFEPCIKRDQSNSWSMMRVATGITFPFQPVIVQRIALTSMSFLYMAFSVPTSNVRCYVWSKILFQRCAELLMGVWSAFALVSVAAILVTLTPIFAIPFIGLFVPPFLLCVLVQWILERIKRRRPDFKEALSWLLPSSCSVLKQIARDVQVGWPLYRLRNLVHVSVYVPLVSTMVSPLLILGNWLAFYVYSGTSDPSGIAHAYQYYYHVDGFTVWLPDLLAFLDVEDWDTLWEVLAGFEDWTSLDPTSLLVASKVVLGMQTALSLLKVVILGVNAALTLMSGCQLFATKKAGATMAQAEELREEEQRSRATDRYGMSPEQIVGRQRA